MSMPGLAAMLAATVLCAQAAAEEGLPPASGSPFYAARSLITADVALAFGYRGGATNAGSWVLVGSGIVNVPLGGNWNEDVEVAEAIDQWTTHYGVFSHTYVKTGDYAAGFVIGGTKANGRTSGAALTVGGEVAVFLPAATLTGQLLYSSGSGGTPNFWTAAGEARWYVDPNTRLSLRASYSGTNRFMLTSGAEHRFPGSMFSVLAAASYSSGTIATWDLVVGMRLIFDQPANTLRDHDVASPFAVGRAISG